MMQGKKARRPKKEVQIGFRVNRAQRERLERAAAAREMTLSEYLREIVVREAAA